MRIIISMLSGTLLMLCLSSPAAPMKEKPEKAPIVFVEKVKTSDLFDTLLYPARLIPKINATILADSDGIITRIETPLGRTVRHNQMMMTITNTDPVYNYAPLKVLAPVAGVVSSVSVTEGSRVTRGQNLATITDPKQIRIDIEVTVSDLAEIRRGMIGNLNVAGQSATVPVKILGISPFVDPASGTATAELGLVDQKHAGLVLLPGVVGTVSFRANQHRGIEVPEYALVYRGQNPFVRVVENGTARLRSVTIGNSRGGEVEITKGLDVGATLVVRANTYVADGEAVQVESSQPELR